MVRSLLDTDLYKISMGQAVFFLFPNEVVRYKFINRGKTPFPVNFTQELALDEFSFLRMHSDELLYLKTKCPWLTAPYLDFLRNYQFNLDEVKINVIDGELTVDIEGPWYRTIFWEVPLMAAISATYFKATGQKAKPENELIAINKKKADLFEWHNILFADFGTRRRFSFENHANVLRQLKEECPNQLIGTSNPFLAMNFGLKPIGTQAHEWIMAIAAKYGFNQANKISMEKWVELYQGDLGIALSDTFTTDAFFSDFGVKYAKLFDGIRQDSGDPKKFADKAIKHYEKLGINPATKTIVFSDGLNPDKIIDIHNHCNGRIKDSYGIGTNLTNDVGVKPLNMVIKLSALLVNGRWVPTIKLSDDPGKHTGDIDSVNLCKKTLNLT